MFLLATLILGACQPLEAAPPPTNPRQKAHTGAVDSHVDSHAEVAQTKPDDHAHHSRHPHASSGPIIPRAIVEEVEPGQEALANAILAASKSSLDECRANSGGGKLRLRVVGNKSSAKITIDPNSNISDSARLCVLEALSTIDVPDTLSQASPSMRPSAGFTSIIAVNW
jgi:hypothetical protein